MKTEDTQVAKKGIEGGGWNRAETRRERASDFLDGWQIKTFVCGGLTTWTATTNMCACGQRLMGSEFWIIKISLKGFGEWEPVTWS